MSWDPRAAEASVVTVHRPSLQDQPLGMLLPVPMTLGAFRGLGEAGKSRISGVPVAVRDLLIADPREQTLVVHDPAS